MSRRGAGGTRTDEAGRVTPPGADRATESYSAGDETPKPLTLADLLAARPTLRPGEVVTLIAPVAGALRTAHAGGAAHGSIRASTIGLTPEGRPVVSGLDSPVTGHGPPTDALLRADLDALRGLLLRCLERCPEAADAGGLIVRSGIGDAAAIEAELFAWAEPQAVRLPTTGGAGRGSAAPSDRAHRVGLHRRPVSGDQRLQRILEWSRSHRGPLTGGIGVVIAAIVALAIVPGPAGRDVAATSSPSSDVPSPRASSTAPAEENAPGPTASARTSPAAVAATGLGPLEAGAILVPALLRCRGEEVRDCVAAVTTVDSPLRRSTETLTGLPDGAEIGLADVNGASAVLAARAPGAAPGTTAASVLMIRTEAGWAIRDVYPAG